MSHMEHANGFTPTHTEHRIISYYAYQIDEMFGGIQNGVEIRKRYRATAYPIHSDTRINNKYVLTL